MTTRDIGTTIKGLAEVTIVAVTVSAGAAGGAVDTVDSRITAAIVYSDRASVERSVELDLAAGDHTLVFAGLPTTVDVTSFRASAEGLPGITILGFNHMTQEHFETPREGAVELERRIRQLTRDSLLMLQDRLNVQTTQKNLLTAMSTEKAQEAAHAAAVGEIDVSSWAQAYEFLGQQLSVVSDSLRRTAFLIEDVTNRVETLERQLSHLHSQRGTVTRVVAVDVRLESAGTATYSLQYLIPGASWRPLYDARLAEGGSTVQLAMFAEVRQNTGEAWDGVDLTLSTVQPSNGTGPGEMLPWYLATSAVRAQPIGRGYGKISGTLTDERTGEPVVGGSVLVVGTRRGAQTDFDGRYLISQVEPGIYTLRITAAGYAPVEVAEVAVKADVMTDQTCAISKTEDDIGKTITVVGRQDKLKIREVSNVVSSTKAEIAHKPVTSADELLTQVSGVVSSRRSERLIRGGRAGEVSYMTDGMPLDDPLGGLGDAATPPMADYAYSAMSTGPIARSFAVPGKQTVSSDRKAVRCMIGQWTIEAKMSLVCRSRLQEGVFRQAELVNATGTPLLPGSMSIFAETSYLGRGEVRQAVVDGEVFSLPFGTTSEVTVARAVLEPKSEIDGKRMEERETVRVTITNHSAKEQVVSLEEALPQSRDQAIEVKVSDIAPEPTEIDEFGLAKWTVAVPAGESRTVQYTYQIRYPRGMRIQGL